MKKILVVLVLVGSMLFCGCAEEEPSYSQYAGDNAAGNAAKIHSEYFDAEILEEGDTYCIVQDRNTGYKYLVVVGYKSSVMTRID